MYLVVGASGFMGSYILESILNKTKEKIIASFYTTPPSIQDERIKWVRFDVRESVAETINPLLNDRSKLKIIYLASFHHPDLVETNWSLAWDINIVALARFLGEIKAFESFFYASTDSVYGNGDKTVPFTEDSMLRPINRYGRQKALAEKICLECKGRVVRFPFLIGPSKQPGKKHFYDEILSNLQSKEAVRLFSDSFRSTLSFKAAADLLIDVAELPVHTVPEILNISSDKPISKFEVGLKIAKKYGYGEELLIPIHQNEAEDIFKTPRAFVTVLNNNKIKKLLGLNEIKFEVQ